MCVCVNLLKSGFYLIYDDVMTLQVSQLIGTTAVFSRFEPLFSGVNHDSFSHYIDTNVSTTPSHTVGEYLPHSSSIQTYRTAVFYAVLNSVSRLNEVLSRKEDITPTEFIKIHHWFYS